MSAFFVRLWPHWERFLSLPVPVTTIQGLGVFEHWDRKIEMAIKLKF